MLETLDLLFSFPFQTKVGSFDESRYIIPATSVFELAGADVVLDGEYPGWKPNADSAILKAMKESYNNKSCFYILKSLIEINEQTFQSIEKTKEFENE